jgi:hypothetical protein
LLLNPQAPKRDSDELTEASLEVLFGLPATGKSASLAKTQDAQFLTWRLESLHKAWSDQDHTGPKLPDGFPIIDPDVIGPDDFRSVVQKPRPQDRDTVFDLWVKRREWIDTQLRGFAGNAEVPSISISTMFDTMTSIVKYSVLGTDERVVVWTDAARGNLTLHWKNLRSDDSMKIAEAKQFIATLLHLSIESFTRLMSLADKDRLYQDTKRTASLTPDEWEDVCSILVQAQKRAYFSKWAGEEQSLGTSLDPRLFWIALKPIREGQWPVKSPTASLIDPVVTKLTELPEHPHLRPAAVTIWETRKKSLEDYRLARRAECEGTKDGFDVMFENAFGWWTPSADPSSTKRKAIAEKLKQLDKDQTDTTAKWIDTTLHMGVDSFRRIAAIDAKARSGQFPTEAEREEVLSVVSPAKSYN